MSFFSWCHSCIVQMIRVFLQQYWLTHDCNYTHLSGKLHCSQAPWAAPKVPNRNSEIYLNKTWWKLASTRPLKVLCGIWDQDISSRSLCSVFYDVELQVRLLIPGHPKDVWLDWDLENLEAKLKYSTCSLNHSQAMCAVKQDAEEDHCHQEYQCHEEVNLSCSFVWVGGMY